MGISHDKVFRIILFAALFLFAPVLKASSDSGVAAILVDYILPHYKEGKYLQFVLYGERAVNLGASITLYNPLIDIVSTKLPDIEVVERMDGIKSPDPTDKNLTELDPKRIYPLYTNYRLIREFWAKYPHSQAIITSGTAIYDKNKKTLTGDGNIHFRSREMDVDGIGFDASQDAKYIYIRRNVRVEYRPDTKALTEESKKLLAEKWNRKKAENNMK